MKKKFKTVAAALMIFIIGPIMASGEIVATYDRNVNYNQYIKYDRYLNVEIWTDDDEYYEGDNIQISFRADNDCFVAIYNVDTRGRVNLIFPADAWEDNRIEGGHVYQIPGRYDEFDLTIQGPPGVEYLHIVASQRPLIIPDWFDGSGLECPDDPYDFIEYIDAMYFGCENDCRRAFDMTSFAVQEWHDYYFRPAYVRHHYNYYYDPFWDWSFYGGVYIDYPFGATIYIDGIYWGIAPLYIPRIYYGWHYVTVYDHYGYCWEDRIHVVKRKEIVLDNRIIKTRSEVKSRFKEVRQKGYLDPVKNGYPEYQKQVTLKKKYQPISKTAEIDRTTNVIVKRSDRGSPGSKTGYGNKTERTIKSKTGHDVKRTYDRKSTQTEKSRSYDSQKRTKSGSESGIQRKSSDSRQKSGSSGSKRSNTGSYKRTPKSTKDTKSSGTYKRSGGSKKSSGSSSDRKKSSSSYKKGSTSSSNKGSKSSSFSGSQKRSSSGTTSSKSTGGSSSKSKRR